MQRPIDRMAEIFYHKGMIPTYLPLFPLNTVLFPGMPLTLHIFEERYKQMINQCVQKHEPFGVVLIQEGVEAMGPLAAPYMIGCTAPIVHLQPLNDGRMNLLAIGQERFRIISLYRDQPYLTGRVERYPLDASNEEQTSHVARRLRPWIEQYLALLGQAGDVELDIDRLPADPLMLGYLAATILQVPPKFKQSLLAAPHLTNLLNDVRQLYQRELPLLRMMLQTDIESLEGNPPPFSLN